MTIYEKLHKIYKGSREYVDISIKYIDINGQPFLNKKGEEVYKTIYEGLFEWMGNSTEQYLKELEYTDDIEVSSDMCFHPITGEYSYSESEYLIPIVVLDKTIIDKVIEEQEKKKNI